MNKKAFTLLEVMIAIAIVALAAGLVGWKMHRMIVRKRFISHVDKLHSRLHTCRRLALNCQADWKCLLLWNGKQWVFESTCVDSCNLQRLPSLTLDSLSVFLNEEKTESLIFYFTASGDIFPKGIVVLQKSPDNQEDRILWKLPDLFLVEEGQQLGPAHPEDLKK